MLAKGKVSDTAMVTGYAEIDFNGAAVTANSAQSNSYTPRMRHLYATYDDSQYGIEVLGGQTWSLLTPETVGMLPRNERVPLTIDNSYVPGFTQTRAPQLRFVKKFGGRYWAGVSFETPQAAYSFTSYSVAGVGTALASGGVLSGRTIEFSNAGSGTLNSTASYSVDVAPDMIVKVAADPGFGHYEAYGLGRLLQNQGLNPGLW